MTEHDNAGNVPGGDDRSEDLTTPIPPYAGNPPTGQSSGPPSPPPPPPPYGAQPGYGQSNYGQPPYAPQGYPNPYGAPASPEPTQAFLFDDMTPVDAPAAPTKQRRGSRTALVLAGALLVGAGGGVAGAATWNALQEEQASPTDRVVSSQVSSTGSAAPAPDGSPQAVAQAVLPSVVKINVVGSEGSGSGSGVILSSDGEILTNDHVVEVAADGGQIRVDFNDGTSAPATVVGTDPVTDLAVIQAEGVSGLVPATLGDSDALAVGQDVVAIGSPFGLQATVTSGIVSALNRPVSVGQSSQGGDSTTYPAIQTDAAINPGNSGGPLVNLDGQVVGINSSIRTSTASLGEEGGSIGLGFAIPISKVIPIVDQLRNGETPTHARLGVSVSDQADEAGLVSGAEIQEVNPGSAADKAGLQSGDIVLAVDDERISTTEGLVATIRGYRPGDEVTLLIQRDGETSEVQVTLDSDAE